MLSTNFVLVTAFLYVAFLFLLAYVSDRQSRRGNDQLLRSPFIYTLSISVYCTSWTFYGAVGSAARNGLEFAAIYLGPTLVFVGWWFLLRKLVRIGHEHRITSIADLISSRYGKSSSLAVLVTCIAVIGTTPYIALQLKAITTSFLVVSNSVETTLSDPTLVGSTSTGLWVAVALAVFTILFGTRNLDANEHNPGVVAAIAFEALVKLIAILAVGSFVVFGIAGGIENVFQYESAYALLNTKEVFGWRWINLMFLSAIAIICLPRQFQITVVENSNESHLRTASWAFPLYLFLISLFVLPIAIVGQSVLPAGSNPDMFLLTLPIHANQDALALLTFIGGFSSATSMVIVASIALSIMISNHIVVPLALRMSILKLHAGGDIQHFLLISRRCSIGVILFLGYTYFRFSSESDALASIGLIAFVGVAQFSPALVGGLFWRNASAKGAVIGLFTGFVLWVYTLFLPSLAEGGGLLSSIVINGPFGIELLKPQALFGLIGLDPLIHSVFWSLGLNMALFIGISCWAIQSPLERLQSTLFVDVFKNISGNESRVLQRRATTKDLYRLSQSILGPSQTKSLFSKLGDGDIALEKLNIPNPQFIAQLERQFTGHIGASTARVLISQITTGETISFEEIISLVDETQQIVEYSHQLEQKSEELKQTADELQKANIQLQQLDSQKDEFLSLVSHEVRTPMTSIRSVVEILLQNKDLDPAQRDHFTQIIHEESLRLTRLLDEILDISLLEHGEMEFSNSLIYPQTIVDRAIDTCLGMAEQADVSIHSENRSDDAQINGDPDRLHQIILNLLTNAIKYNTHSSPEVRISCSTLNNQFVLEVRDNGEKIQNPEKIFEKFNRDQSLSANKSGSGLGLAISRQLATQMNGSLELIENNDHGHCFKIELPLVQSQVNF